MLKIRRPLGCLIFNMGIAIPGKTVFLIETAPRSLSYWCCIPLRHTVNTWRNRDAIITPRQEFLYILIFLLRNLLDIIKAYHENPDTKHPAVKSIKTWAEPAICNTSFLTFSQIFIPKVPNRTLKQNQGNSMPLFCKTEMFGGTSWHQTVRITANNNPLRREKPNIWAHLIIACFLHIHFILPVDIKNFREAPFLNMSNKYRSLCLYIYIIYIFGYSETFPCTAKRIGPNTGSRNDIWPIQHSTQFRSISPKCKENNPISGLIGEQ